MKIILFFMFLTVSTIGLALNEPKETHSTDLKTEQTIHTYLSGLKTEDEQVKFSADDGDIDDRFGVSVSLYNNMALIGSYYDDDLGSNSGAAYIFEHHDGIWSQTAKLKPSDGEAGGFFGWSVSLHDNRAIIGSRGKDSDTLNDAGAAYVFELDQGAWLETGKLVASDAGASDWFGFAVSLHEDTALIGSIRDDDSGEDSGSAYVFELNKNGWQEVQKLNSNDGSFEDNFGWAVSLENTRAVISAPGDDRNVSDLGAVYVFELGSGVWSQTDKLFDADGIAFDSFGNSVSYAGDKILIGAEKADDNGNSSGAVHVFEYSFQTWSYAAKLLPDDGVAEAAFGSSISLSGSQAIIGADKDDDNGFFSGSAYIFKNDNGVWSQLKKVTPKDGVEYGNFGTSVSLNSNLSLALVGAFRIQGFNLDEGAVYSINLDYIYSDGFEN